MTKNTCGRSRRNRPAPSVPVRPVYPEPPVHRWPHNTAEALPEQERDAVIYYIRCALSYQNQMLSEIKSLLEQFAVEKPEHATDEKNSG